MASRHRAYAHWLILLSGLALLLLLPGYAISRKLGGDEAVVAMLLGCGLCWIAAALGGLPQLWIESSPQQAASMTLGSLAIRMGLTLFGALGLVLATEVARTAFLLWVAASYLVFLIADVVFVLTRKPADSR